VSAVAEGLKRLEEADGVERVVDLGDDMALALVKVASLREQDINAQVMQPETFERLVENVRARGALESMPYCYLPGRIIEVISGHHRVRSARAAEKKQIWVLVDLLAMTLSQVRSKQIAHNELSGKPDEEILRRMVAQIDHVDDLLATGLSADSGLLPVPTTDSPPLHVPHAEFDWRTVVFTFLPHQLERWDDLIKSLPSADHVGVVDVELYERFVRSMAAFSRFKDIKSVGTAVAALAQIAEERVACFSEETTDERWVKIESLFPGDSVPAHVGMVVIQAIQKLIATDQIKGQNPWEALELWAAGTLAE
jgi:hypothetical protein